VDHYRFIDEASAAGVLEDRPGTVAAAQAGAPFLSQIEQLLGEEAEPDAEFFIDSWTVGVAAASENFLRRQQAVKRPKHETPAWDTFVFFPPFYAASVDASAVAAWHTGEARAVKASIMNPGLPSNDDEDNWRAEEVDMARPLTIESACRVLGVGAASSREQLRAAYRKMASRYHPDRLLRSEAREQKLASDRMASINEAYRLLCTGLAGQWGAC